jgi:hypothetical protein
MGSADAIRISGCQLAPSASDVATKKFGNPAAARLCLPVS